MRSINSDKFLECILFLILLLSILPMQFSTAIVFSQLLLCLVFICSYKLEINRLVIVLLFLVLLLLSFSLKVNIDTKDILLVFCLLISTICIKIELVKLEAFLKQVLLLILFVCLLQAISPEFPNWALLAENSGQRHIFSLGYASYSLLGNPTHTAYITLFFTVVLLSINSKKLGLWSLVGLVILILAKNKVCLLTYLLVVSVIFFQRLTGIYKLCSVVFFCTLAYMSWMLVFSEYSHWLNTDISQIHTISYRLEVFYFVKDWLFSGFNFFLGSNNGLSEINQPFDSGLLLLVFKYGVPLAFFIYLFVYFLCGRSFILFTTLALPSLTMVAFYNAQFMLCIVLVSILRRNYGKG